MADAARVSAVLIDSTVLYADPGLDRAYARLVLEHAALGRFELIVPDLVLRESGQKFAERQTAAYQELDKPVAELRRLGVSIEVPTPAQREAVLIRYADQLASLANAQGVRVAALPDVSHEDLVQRSLGKRKPFSADGVGYRDALLWHSVLEAASKGRVAFVTANTRDFCAHPAGGELALNLRHDLVDRGLKGDAVVWFRDLKSLVDDLIPAVDLVREELVDRIEHDAGLRAELQEAIGSASMGFGLANDVHLRLPDDSDEITVQWIDVLDVTVTDAYESSSDGFIIELSGFGDASLDLFVPKWASWRDGELMIIDGDWNEWVMYASAIRRLGYSATITYDSDMRSFADDLDVIEMFAAG